LKVVRDKGACRLGSIPSTPTKTSNVLSRLTGHVIIFFEIQEEYNAKVLDFEFLGFRDVHRSHNGKPTHWIALDYKVLIDPEGVKINEPRKFGDLDWFTMDNLPQPVHSQLPEFLEKYQKKL